MRGGRDREKEGGAREGGGGREKRSEKERGREGGRERERNLNTDLSPSAKIN